MLSFFKKVEINEIRIIKKFQTYNVHIYGISIERYYKDRKSDILSYYNNSKLIQINPHWAGDFESYMLPSNINNDELILQICAYYKQVKFPGNCFIKTIQFCNSYEIPIFPESFKFKEIELSPTQKQEYIIC
jgi:hypothetical protein